MLRAIVHFVLPVAPLAQARLTGADLTVAPNPRRGFGAVLASSEPGND